MDREHQSFYLALFVGINCGEMQAIRVFLKTMEIVPFVLTRLGVKGDQQVKYFPIGLLVRNLEKDS